MKDGATVKAQLWDTAGTEKYRAITVAHYRKARGCLIVYDITNYESFKNVRFWLDNLLSQAEQDIQIMLVGNKVDLVEEDPSKRQVTQAEARGLCSQQKDMKFIETSTKTNSNVKGAFEQLLSDIYFMRQNSTKEIYQRQPFKMLETPSEQTA